MAIRVVRLGSDRSEKEGLRIGTVRRPPRGVPKAEFASKNYYDVWLPNVSPSPETMKRGQQATTEKEWQAFEKQYAKEMARPETARVVELLAALSRDTDFSIGCYCQDEHRCHRSVLKKILAGMGAVMAETDPAPGD